MALFLRQLPDPIELALHHGEAVPVESRAGRRLARSGLLAVLGRGQAPANLGAAFPDASHLVRVPCVLSVGPDGGSAGPRIIGLPPDVRVAARALPRVGRVTYSRARSMLRSLARDLDMPPDDLNPELDAILVFADVSWGGGELLAAALATAGPDLPVVGGTFEAAGLSLDGVARRGGAVIALIDSEVPLAPFLVHPYRLTDVRTVVTACDDSGHVVSELDGYPARTRFCELVGVDADEVVGDAVMQELSAQLAWMVAGRPVTRPVVGAEGDCLHLAGAVPRGTVLRLITRAPDVARTVTDGVSSAIAALPVPAAAALAFGCKALFRGPGGADVIEGLSRLGVVGVASRGILHGPVHTCGGVSGLVLGDAGA